MFATKRTGAIKAAVILGAVALSLGVSTGQLTAATASTNVSSNQEYSVAAQQPGVVSTAIYADSRPDVFARAGAARDAFGFPVGAKRSGRHVHDGFQKSDYDEVSEVDSSNKPLSMTQFDAGGNLLSAVRFDTDPGQTAAASGDSAVKSAQRGLAASGMPVSGQPRTQANTVTGGWDIQWDRVEAGFAVRGDETHVHVWQNGKIQSVARVQHDLAPAPDQRLGQAQAHQAVDGRMSSWLAGTASGYSIQAMDMEWVGPNAAFDTSKLGQAPEPYRLAWVANVKPSGAAADGITLITLFVDAGDGTIIGGDVVE
jgi:hypothetical protein